MALLRLRPIDHRTPPPQLAPSRLKAIGQHLLKRMLAEWPRFFATWHAFRAELAAGGMDGRGQDTFGTLLACADMALYKGWNEERLSACHDGDLKPWSSILAAANVAEFEDATENWRGCLSHMLSVTPEPWRNSSTVSAGQILSDYWNNTAEGDFSTAKKQLAKVGLALVKVGRTSRPNYLAVPNQGVLTRSLFAGSKWAGDMGASVWAGALRQAEDHLFKVDRARVNGVICRCTLLSLEALYGEGGLMAENSGQEDGAL